MLRRRVLPQYGAALMKQGGGSNFCPVKMMTSTTGAAMKEGNKEAVKMKVPPYFWFRAAKMMRDTLSELIEKEREEAGTINKYVWEKLWSLEEGNLIQHFVEREQKKPGSIEEFISMTKAEVEQRYRNAKMLEETYKSLEKKLLQVDDSKASLDS